MVFGNGVKNIQAAAYNGARTVDNIFTYQSVETDVNFIYAQQLILACFLKVLKNISRTIGIAKSKDTTSIESPGM